MVVFRPGNGLQQRGITNAVEHAWENHHPIHLEETTVLDHGRGQELLVKEALHIQMTRSTSIEMED